MYMYNIQYININEFNSFIFLLLILLLPIFSFLLFSGVCVCKMSKSHQFRTRNREKTVEPYETHKRAKTNSRNTM